MISAGAWFDMCARSIVAIAMKPKPTDMRTSRREKVIELRNDSRGIMYCNLNLDSPRQMLIISE